MFLVFHISVEALPSAAALRLTPIFSPAPRPSARIPFLSFPSSSSPVSGSFDFGVLFPFFSIDRRQVLRWIEADGSAKSFFCDAGCGGERDKRVRGAPRDRPYDNLLDPLAAPGYGKGFRQNLTSRERGQASTRVYKCYNREPPFTHVRISVVVMNIASFQQPFIESV